MINRMSKSTLIINGSTRVNGNTDILIERVAEGAKDVDVNTTVIELKNKKIRDCIGCYKCLNESRCSLEDDMADIYNQINKSDLLIFVSPLYWCGVTGLMKTFIDRFFFYYHPQNKMLISGKKAIVVAPMNMNKDIYKTKIFIEFFNILFENLDLVKINIFLFDNTSEKGEILNNPDHIDQAYAIGKNL